MSLDREERIERDYVDRWFPTLEEIRHAADVLQAVSVIYDYHTPEAAQWSAERLRGYL